jgi:hypothetical protein
MLVVILGAGASFDSVAPQYQPTLPIDQAWRPPVASDLFGARQWSFGPTMDGFPEARPLIMRLAASVARGVPVEDAIQAETEAIGGTPYGARQLASLRFYLQAILWQAGVKWGAAAHHLTNYSALADEIERWREANDEGVTYITFNYDLMLEDALKPIATFNTFGDYIAGRTKLIKAHGSVDWGHATTTRSGIVNDDARRMLVRDAPELASNAVGWRRFVSFDDSHPADRRRELNQLLYPALALPTSGKAGFECPEDHRDAMTTAIAQMTRLLVIGWRAQEEHLLELLDGVGQEVKGHIVTSKADSAASIAAVLSGRMKRLSAEPFGAGFSGYLDLGNINSLFGRAQREETSSK